MAAKRQFPVRLPGALVDRINERVDGLDVTRTEWVEGVLERALGFFEGDPASTRAPVSAEEQAVRTMQWGAAQVLGLEPRAPGLLESTEPGAVADLFEVPMEMVTGRPVSLEVVRARRLARRQSMVREGA